METKRDFGHEALLYDLKWLVNMAEGNQYHDFKNTSYAMPKVALVSDLDMLINRTKEGKYDN